MRVVESILGSCALVATLAMSTQAAVVGREANVTFTGIRVETALVNPERADTGTQYGGSLALGSLFKPWLHFNVGVARWTADIDRSGLGNPVKGTISDFVLSTDLRAQPVRLGRLRPYLLAGIAAHVVGADVPEDPSLEDALADFSPGFDMGLGIRTNRSGLGAAFEARRRFVDTVDNWTFQLGIGWIIGDGSGSSPRSAVPMASAPVMQQPAFVAAPAVPDARQVESLERIARAMRALTEENRALRADMDSLRRAMAAGGSATPDVPPSPPTGAAVPAPVVDETAARRAALGDALKRVPFGNENPGALRETPSGYRITMTGPFAFATSRAELSIPAREAIRQIALVMFRFQDAVATIEGHADSWGTPEGNVAISAARAESVRSELTRLGIDPDRITSRGLGSDSPIADNSTPEGRARNRRVEILLEIR